MMNKIGICQGAGQTLINMKVGNNRIDFSKNGRKYNTLLNGRTVMEAKSDKEFIHKSMPVISVMTKAMCKTGNKTVILTKKNDSELIDNLLKNMKDNLGNAEIFVLESHPDETVENTMPETRSAKMTLGDFEKDIPQMGETIDNSMRLSEILLKTNLPKTMWGGKEVSSILNEVHSNMESTPLMQEDLEICFEQAQNNIRLFQSTFSGGHVASEKMLGAKETAGKIIDNFTTIKTAVSELSQNLNKLYAIDSIFKKATGYPATWFLNSSIFYDFNFEYDSLIDHMVKMAKLESDAIEPLMVWKIKVTGDSNVK